jgi:two-component system, LytTR family, sensor kinase
MKKDLYKRLLRIALITSPLMGLFSVTPAFFFIDHRPIHAMNTPALFPYRHLVAMFTISLMAFILWNINIGLYRYAEKKQWTQNARFPKNISRYLISLLLAACFPLLLKLTVASFTDIRPPGRGMMPFLGIISNDIFILIILDLVVLQVKKSKIELENTYLKMKNLQTEHEHLKNQIHPHFLFNSLYTLKVLIKKQPLEAEAYLLKLSDFLRTSISYSGRNTMTLADDLKYCMEYLDMQKMRFGKALQFDIDIPEHLLYDASLPIFTLQSLAENAIKHNTLTVDKPLMINVSVTDAGLIEFKNKISKKNFTEPSTAMGLKNLIERYELLSLAAKPEILVSEGYFIVRVKILKDENSNH